MEKILHVFVVKMFIVAGLNNVIQSTSLEKDRAEITMPIYRSTGYFR